MTKLVSLFGLGNYRMAMMNLCSL